MLNDNLEYEWNFSGLFSSAGFYLIRLDGVMFFEITFYFCVIIYYKKNLNKWWWRQNMIYENFDE